MEVALILEEIGLAVLACEVRKIYVTCVVEAVLNLAKIGLAWSRIATIKNIVVTCLVEVDFNPHKLGLCRAITVNILTIGLRMAVTAFVLTLGLCIALMVYIKVIGLSLHRIHITEIHEALALNKGMVAVGVSEECPRSQRLGSLADLPGASRHREPTPVWRLDPLVRPCHEGLVKHRKPLVGPDGQTGSGALCGLEAGNTASTSSNRSMSSRRTS